MKKFNQEVPPNVLSLIALIISVVSLSISLSFYTLNGSVQGSSSLSTADQKAVVAPETPASEPYSEALFTASPKVYVSTSGPTYFKFHAVIPFYSGIKENIVLTLTSGELSAVLDQFTVFADDRGELVISVDSQYIMTSAQLAVGQEAELNFNLVVNGLDFNQYTTVIVK